jgi:DmsE family decaheme c-type cytochrome
MRLKSLIATAGAVCLAAFLASPAFAQAPAYGQAKQTQPICASCHEAQWTSIDLTAHGAKSDANGSMCQACHGDSTAHLANPMTKPADNQFRAGGDAAKQAAVCMTCHSGNRNLAFWTSGKHALNDVACTNCHSVHGKKLTPTINKFVTTFLPNQADACGTCHQQIRAATFKPSHHPIQEGKVKCSDCHNPHGALSPSMVKQPTINDQCYSCHADKRGPYVFNHPPVEENCASCHNPHGSVHYKLLNEHTPNLCQDCHEWSRHPGTIYGAAGGWTCPEAATQDPANTACYRKTPGSYNTGVSTRLIDRNCLNCHNSIHGSNAPGNRGKFLTR